MSGDHTHHMGEQSRQTCGYARSLRHIVRKAIQITLITLFASLCVWAVDIPSLYQCRAVRLTQSKGAATHSKAFQVEHLFIRIERNELRVFGIHSKINICRKLGIRRIVRDTLFLENPEELPMGHSALKLHFDKDTLVGNANLFESDTSEVTLKVLVKKVTGRPPVDFEEQCR